MHVFMSGWKNKLLLFNLCFTRGRSSQYQLITKQHSNGLNVTDIIVPLNKADCSAARLFGMVVPFVATYRYAVVTGKAFILAG